MQLRVDSVTRIEGSILCREQVDPNKPEYNNKMIGVISQWWKMTMKTLNL